MRRKLFRLTLLVLLGLQRILAQDSTFFLNVPSRQVPLGFFNPLAADENGAYAIWNEWMAEPMGGRFRAVLVKYDRSGTELWLRPFESPEQVWAAGIAAVSGQIYALGRLDYRVVGRDGPMILKKFDTSGTELWSRQFPGRFGGALTADATGVYAAAAASDNVWMVKRYDPRGNELWAREFQAAAPPTLVADGGGSHGSAVRRAQVRLQRRTTVGEGD
jgi:hypothetical protein